MKTFAELLREYRGDRSQLKVATELDISPSYYSELERGLKQPSYKILAQIILNSGVGKDYWIDTDLDHKNEQHRVSSPMAEGDTLGRAPEDMKISEIIMWLSALRVHLENIVPSLTPADKYALYYTFMACQRVMEKK